MPLSHSSTSTTIAPMSHRAGVSGQGPLGLFGTLREDLWGRCDGRQRKRGPAQEWICLLRSGARWCSGARRGKPLAPSSWGGSVLPSRLRRGVGCRVLFGRAVSPAQGNRMLARLPGADLVEDAGAGHDVPLDQLALLRQSLTGFILRGTCSIHNDVRDIAPVGVVPLRPPPLPLR
jgi:hypothetical protein